MDYEILIEKLRSKTISEKELEVLNDYINQITSDNLEHDEDINNMIDEYDQLFLDLVEGEIKR